MSWIVSEDPAASRFFVANKAINWEKTMFKRLFEKWNKFWNRSKTIKKKDIETFPSTIGQRARITYCKERTRVNKINKE